MKYTFLIKIYDFVGIVRSYLILKIGYNVLKIKFLIHFLENL